MRALEDLVRHLYKKEATNNYAMLVLKQAILEWRLTKEYRERKRNDKAARKQQQFNFAASLPSRGIFEHGRRDEGLRSGVASAATNIVDQMQSALDVFPGILRRARFKRTIIDMLGDATGIPISGFMRGERATRPGPELRANPFPILSQSIKDAASRVDRPGPLSLLGRETAAGFTASKTGSQGQVQDKQLKVQKQIEKNTRKTSDKEVVEEGI